MIGSEDADLRLSEHNSPEKSRCSLDSVWSQVLLPAFGTLFFISLRSFYDSLVRPDLLMVSVFKSLREMKTKKKKNNFCSTMKTEDSCRGEQRKSVCSILMPSGDRSTLFLLLEALYGIFFLLSRFHRERETTPGSDVARAANSRAAHN